MGRLLTSSRDSILSLLVSSAFRPLPGVRGPCAGAAGVVGAVGVWAKAPKAVALANTRTVLEMRVLNDDVMLCSWGVWQQKFAACIFNALACFWLNRLRGLYFF
jgi:hypothetical protein